MLDLAIHSLTQHVLSAYCVRASLQPWPFSTDREKQTQTSPETYTLVGVGGFRRHKVACYFLESSFEFDGLLEIQPDCPRKGSVPCDMEKSPVQHPRLSACGLGALRAGGGSCKAGRGRRLALWKGQSHHWPLDRSRLSGQPDCSCWHWQLLGVWAAGSVPTRPGVPCSARPTPHGVPLASLDLTSPVPGCCSEAHIWLCRCWHLLPASSSALYPRPAPWVVESCRVGAGAQQPRLAWWS